MSDTQFGGPNAQEPTGRKPDGRCPLNRLSPDRQAAVADYAASHTPPETVEWLNRDSQRSKLKLGLEVIAQGFRDNPEAREHYEQACKMIEPGCPPEETPQTHKPPVKWAFEPKCAEMCGNVRKKIKNENEPGDHTSYFILHASYFTLDSAWPGD